MKGGWCYQRGLELEKGGLPAPVWESMGERMGLGFPLPTLCFWGLQVRFASGINLCLHRRGAGFILRRHVPRHLPTGFAGALLPAKPPFTATFGFSRVQQAAGDGCKEDAKRWERASEHRLLEATSARNLQTPAPLVAEPRG